MNNDERYKKYADCTQSYAGFYQHKVINKKRVIEIVRNIQTIFFPGYFEEISNIDKYIHDKCQAIYENMRNEMEKVSIDCFINGFHIDELTKTFMNQLFEVRDHLESDIAAIMQNDPAAKSKDEIILAYPGLYAIFIYRVAHILYQENVEIIPRIMSEYAHEKTGIDIHPGAEIGKFFFIDHGTGIVIGETSVIGDNVRLYQGVTIGAKNLKDGSKLKGLKRHPTIKNNVIIYANAAILGGDTVIGNGVIVGSNVFITSSIPDNMKVLSKNYEIVLIGGQKNE